MSKSKNYYDILEVSETASQDEIKKNFRKLAAKHHPDKHQGDKSQEELFKEINEAYRVLSDEQERAAYDRKRKGHHGGFGGFEGFGGFGGGFNPDTFGDDVFQFFSRANFSRGRKELRPKVNIHKDVQITGNISLLSAIKGGSIVINIKVAQGCVSCKGSGFIKTNNECTHCDGLGFVKVQHDAALFVTQECQQCKGTGFRLNVCKACDREGFVSKQRSVKVEVPAGVPSGSKLRVSNLGNTDYYGQTGDVILKILYPQQEGVLSVDSNGNLYTSIDVSFIDLMSNSEIDLDIEGVRKIQLKLSPESKNNENIIFKGMGMRTANDLIVKLNVYFDKNDISSEDLMRLQEIFTKYKGCKHQLKNYE